MPRPSLLDLYVKLSLHTAPETLSYCFCPCVYNRGTIYVLLQGYRDSNYRDFHRRDEDVLSRFL